MTILMNEQKQNKRSRKFCLEHFFYIFFLHYSKFKDQNRRSLRSTSDDVHSGFSSLTEPINTQGEYIKRPNIHTENKAIFKDTPLKIEFSSIYAAENRLTTAFTRPGPLKPTKGLPIFSAHAHQSRVHPPSARPPGSVPFSRMVPVFSDNP